MEATKASFESRIEELRPLLRHIAFRLTSNPADAEDLVQLALMKALEYRERLRRDSNLKAWLRTVMQHQAIDENRKESRRVPWMSQLDQLPAPAVAPRVVWDALSSDDVKQALVRCPQHLRRAFELQQFDGRSLAEISTILGIPRATVATRLHRARARLRRLLEPQTDPKGSPEPPVRPRRRPSQAARVAVG